MKNNLLLVLLGIFFVGCGTKDLSKEQAKSLIKKDNHYPKPYKFRINRITADYVSRIEAAGLETAGLVSLKKDWSVKGMNEPKIFFTEKAKPYLLGPDQGETEKEWENVKIANMDVDEVTGIAVSSDGKTAKADYTVRYTEVTPFKALVKKNLDEVQLKKAYFRLYDDGWRIDKTAEADVLVN